MADPERTGKPWWYVNLSIIWLDCYCYAYNYTGSSPLSRLIIELSDIIPLIQKLDERFITGQTVYTPIEDFGYHMAPNYMPMHWMPYCVSRLLHFDPRWLSIAIAAIAGIWIARRNVKYNNQPLSIY